METDTFDIQIGMDAFTAGGKKIGRVTEVAGFGSTHIPGISAQGASEVVTEARTGTGYIIVDRTQVVGTRDAASLCVPFHDIATVTQEKGVILTESADTKLRHTPDAQAREMVPDSWISLAAVATMTGRDSDGLIARVKEGKIRSKRSRIPPFTRLYSREDAEREIFQRGESRTEAGNDWTKRTSERDTP